MERGVPSIKVAYNRVDYGDSFLLEEGIAPRRLEYDLDGEANMDRLKRSADQIDSKCVPNDNKRANLSLEVIENDEHGKTAGSEDTSGDESSDKGSDQEPTTKEQAAILSHDPEVGEVVAVNAYAGCGKTTTIALLCNKVEEYHPHDTQLYLVYNESMEREAKQSNKFPQNMEIRTTHAYVLRHYFGTKNQHKVEPKGEYPLKEIVSELELVDYVREKFKTTIPQGEKGERWIDKRANQIAGYIKKTINNFQQSKFDEVQGDHVSKLSLTGSTKRTKWKSEVKGSQYIKWAEQFFRTVQNKCRAIQKDGSSSCKVSITHDGYLKVAQLERLKIHHDWVFIDEAQDMTACQADLFWGNCSNRRTYLFGDCFQQIYRFRGASRIFEDEVKKSSSKFTLTGSFRFGENIAQCASIILSALGGDILQGRSRNSGNVELLREDDNSALLSQKGIVLCRTQNGIFKYLHANKPARWCYLKKKPNFSEAVPKWQHELESFLNGKQKSFTYRRETFATKEQILEFIDDEGDIDLYKAFTLLTFLSSCKKSLEEFYSKLKKTYSPMEEGESPDKYNGMIMSTVHMSKGLEFMCPVIISDDFNFEAITSHVVNKNFHSSEAHHLYVAITRAKSHLILCPIAANCVRKLSNHTNIQLPSNLTQDTSNDMFEAWKVKWKQFSDGLSDDLPYPPDWDNSDRPFALHPSISVHDQKRILHFYLRRVHPDKFLPKFSKRLKPGWEKTLKQIVVKCTEMLESLRSEDT